MDLVKGAALLAELFGESSCAPAEPTACTETGPPIFRWFGVEPPAEPEPERAA